MCFPSRFPNGGLDTSERGGSWRATVTFLLPWRQKATRSAHTFSHEPLATLLCWSVFLCLKKKKKKKKGFLFIAQHPAQPQSFCHELCICIQYVAVHRKQRNKTLPFFFLPVPGVNSPSFSSKPHFIIALKFRTEWNLLTKTRRVGTRFDLSRPIRGQIAVTLSLTDEVPFESGVEVNVGQHDWLWRLAADESHMEANPNTGSSAAKIFTLLVQSNLSTT